MPTSESKRLALREKLAEALGSETAGNLMEHIPPERWDELVTKTDLRQLADKMATKDDLRQLADQLTDKMATKDNLHQMADLLRKEEQADLKQLRGEMHEQFGKMREESGSLHKELGKMHEQFGKMREESGSLHKELGKMQARSAEQQTQLIAMMTGQHRMTMVALAGVFVATVASLLIPLIPLLTSSPV